MMTGCLAIQAAAFSNLFGRLSVSSAVCLGATAICCFIAEGWHRK
jgi:hypothetical protein